MANAAVSQHKILHSIYGKRFGLTRAGATVVDGHLDSPSWRDMGVLAQIYDHFFGITLNTNLWQTRKGSDGACVIPTVTDSLANGRCVFTTGAGAGASMAVNGSELHSYKQFDIAQAANSVPLSLGGSLQLSAITNICAFIGMADNDASLAMPFTISGGTLTANATDGYGWLFDTAATAATWKFVGVANGTVTAIGDSGVAPVAAADQLFEIENDGAGNASFYLNDTLYGTVAGCGRTAHYLTPTVAVFTRSAASATLSLDFLSVMNSR